MDEEDVRLNMLKANEITQKSTHFKDFRSLFSHVYKQGSALEGAVKPFVINRKVFMTSGSYDGARYTTLLFSIIRTARMNDLNVSKYLVYVLDHIQTKPIKDLLPYSKKLNKSLGTHKIRHFPPGEISTPHTKHHLELSSKWFSFDTVLILDVYSKKFHLKRESMKKRIT